MTKTVAQIEKSDERFFVLDIIGNRTYIEVKKTHFGDYQVTLKEPNWPPKVFLENGSVEIKNLCS